MDINLLNSIPDSDSDILLQKWGYDLKKECFRLIEYSEMSRQHNVLDLATGSGRICSVLTRFRYNVITGDYKLPDIDKARRRISSKYLQQVKFASLDMEKLPFVSNSVHNMVCVNTLHELQNPLLCLDEILRVHSGKGKLLISDFSPKGFELMQKIHEIVYRNNHTTGSISMEEVRKVLSSRYYYVRSFNSALLVSYIAWNKI